MSVYSTIRIGVYLCILGSTAGVFLMVGKDLVKVYRKIKKLLVGEEEI